MICLFLLVLEVGAQTCGGSCTVPVCTGSTSCATGCDSIAATPGSCAPPSTSHCLETYSTATDCNAAPGCAWVGTSACVRTTPKKCFEETDGNCLPGCESHEESCVSYSSKDNERCKQRPSANCAKYSDNKWTWCKWNDTENICVAMSDEERYIFTCNSIGVGNCESDSDGSCKLSGGFCIPKTQLDEINDYCDTLTSSNCTGAYCVWTSGKCVAKTESEVMEAGCDEIGKEDISECTKHCHVVSGKCVWNPAYEEPAAFCVAKADNSDCDVSLSDHDCTKKRTCVPYDCTKKLDEDDCDTNSAAAGCTYESGYCDVDPGLTCTAGAVCSATEITAGCISTAAESAKCVLKPSLAEGCVGAGVCSTNAVSAGCTSIAGTEQCPGGTEKDPDNGSSVMTFTAHFLLFILFALML